jgi:hypothetical protein
MQIPKCQFSELSRIVLLDRKAQAVPIEIDATVNVV